MCSIAKISGYVLGEDPVQEKFFSNDLERLGYEPRHVHVTSADVSEEDFEELLANENIDLAKCEKHFKREPTVVHGGRSVEVGACYRHFKGKIVRVIGIAQDTENPGCFDVIYTCADGRWWHRPLDMFLSPVDREKYLDVEQAYRFELDEEATMKAESNWTEWVKEAPNPELIAELKEQGLFPRSIGNKSITWSCKSCGARGMLHWAYCPKCGKKARKKVGDVE